MSTVRKRPKNQGITIIKKANDLIEARYKFDIWETRFFLSVLAQIRREDNEFQTYRVWYRDVVRTFGLKNHNAYDLLRQASVSLMQKSFTVNYEDNGFARQANYHIIRKTDVLKEGQEHRRGIETQEYIDVTIEQEMKPLLLQLQKNFTAYELRNVVKLGVYPIRIYELLKQYESIGERTVAVETLKNMFELHHEYPRFPNFNQRVIEPAIEDINRHSDLDIRTVEKIKDGRAVTALRFKFSTKSEAQLLAAREADRFPKVPQLQIAFPEAQEAEEDAAEEEQAPYEHHAEKDRLFQHFYPEVVEKLGVTPSAFLELLHSHTETQVEQAIRVTRRAQSAGQIKTSPAGFFVHALKHGFTDKQEETLKKQKNAAENAAVQLQRLREQMEALEVERRAAANEVIRELTQTDPFLAGEAVSKIMLNNPVRQSLEIQTGLVLDANLPMDTWRENKPMREAVIRQIEVMRPEAFKGVKNTFDGPLAKLRQAIETAQRG